MRVKPFLDAEAAARVEEDKNKRRTILKQIEELNDLIETIELKREFLEQIKEEHPGYEGFINEQAEKIFFVPPSIRERDKNSDQFKDGVFTKINDFLSQQDQEIEWLVDCLIPQNWMGIIAGKSKNGKTLLSLSLAKAVATGEEFLNRKTAQGPVALVMLDDPPSLVRKRLFEFGFTDEMPVFVSTTRFKENNFFDQLRDELEEIQPKLVIVDTLVKTIPKTLGSENDSAVMDEALEKFMKIGETCGYPNFLFIHHFNKSGGLRGSSAIEGAAPLVVKVTRKEDGTVELEFETKIEPIPPMVIEFDSENCTFNYLGERDQLHERQLEDQVLDFLKEEPESTATEIAKAVEVRRDKVDLILKGSLRVECKEEKSGRGRPKRVYFLSGTGTVNNKTTVATRKDFLSHRQKDTGTNIQKQLIEEFDAEEIDNNEVPF